MNAPKPSLLQRWLALLLIGLLALAPFVHGHFGSSHESGFHVDGLHEMHHSPVSADASMHAADDESQAHGITASLPENSHAMDWPVALCLVLLPVLCTPRQRPARRRAAIAGERPVYRVGLPPPSLAPPLG